LKPNLITRRRLNTAYGNNGTAIITRHSDVTELLEREADFAVPARVVPLSDRTRPILDGRVQVPGVEFVALPGEPEDIFKRALRDRAFEVSELSMGSHITTTARGDSPYIGVPVFLSRACRHSAIYIRTDRGITRPEDLAGRTIALPEYQQTAALWVRGILRETHGVDTRGIKWRIGAERIAIALPEGFDVAPLGETPEQALREGRVDAMIGPRPPAPHPQITRLSPDYPSAGKAWFTQTGFFPIMHCLAVRRDVAEAHPWLPLVLFRAFAEARRLSLEELRLVTCCASCCPGSPPPWRSRSARGAAMSGLTAS